MQIITQNTWRAILCGVDHAKRASIDLNAEFSGQDAPPQAYFSQSHLDTLGLCIFLALALREKPGETVLILDDVLGSVDVTPVFSSSWS